MKKTILVFLIISALVCANSNLSTVSEQLNQLQTTANNFLLGVTTLLLVVGIITAAIAVLVYFKKLKGVEKKGKLWIAAAIIFSIISAMLILGGIIGIMIYIITPHIVKGLLMG